VTSGFLVGVLAAWSAAHLGLALFFTLAHLIGRREREYLLFGLLCVAFSVLTAGMTLDFAVTPLEGRFFADQITHTGAIFAAAINLHFALTFARPGPRHPLFAAVYWMAAAFSVATWLGLLWVPGSQQVVRSLAFGFTIEHTVERATALGVLYYLTVAAETAYAVFALFEAYRGGRREILPAFVTLSLVALATLNDLTLDMGLVRNTSVLLPHCFMLYAFGTAGTLLFRYRVAAGELELTASSLRQRTEELRHSYAELAQVQSELVTKKQLAAVGELAAAIAHEVRNPLAVIVNAVSGLRRSGIREEDRAMLLDIVDEEAGRLNRLVTDLLRFARPVNVKRSSVSLGELANRSRASVAKGFQLAVESTDDPGGHVVEADPNLLRLVFDNLVSNACQSMSGGGVVEIRLGHAELRGRPAARVEIRDRGHGMDAHVMERALDPFFTTRPSGTGLGLPIVNRIIEAHGGELLLESPEGGGTRVTVMLPVHGPEEAESGIMEKIA
jgi:signal transduction histidine kinase